MTATTNLTWIKQTAERRTCSDPRFSMAMSPGRRFTLYCDGVAVCKGTKAACEAFANDIAAGRLSAYPPQQQQPSDVEAAAAELRAAAVNDMLRTGELKVVTAGPAADAGIDEAVAAQQQPAAEAEALDAAVAAAQPAAEAEALDAAVAAAQPAAGLFPAGYDENIIADAAVMPAAESRTKPGREPVKLTETLEIAGQTYVRRNYAPEHGHEVVGLSGPKGVEYRCLLYGAESVCSCPAFEHRGGWCKHLDALVGPRNATKGVDVEPEPKPEVMPSAASRTKKVDTVNAGGGIMVDVVENVKEPAKAKKTPDQLNAEAKKRGKQPAPAAAEPDAVRDDEPKATTRLQNFQFIGTPAPEVPGPTAARLETLPTGAEFHLNGKNGKLVDVNEGFATVRLEGEHANQQWSPATEVKLGRFSDNRKRSEIRIMVEGEASDPQNSGEPKMKVTSTALTLLFGELGASPSKVAKWTAADFGSRIKQLPDKAKGKTVTDAKAAKLLKDILAALEEGEDIAVEMATAPEANGTAKKAAKAEANGHAGKNGKGSRPKAEANGHAGKGKKTKPDAAGKARPAGAGVDAFGARLGSRKAQINALLSAKTPKTVKQVREEGNIPGSYIDYFNELAAAKVIKGDHEKGWVLAK